MTAWRLSYAVRAPASLLLACMTFGPSPAASADLAASCCADLEERIAELEAASARTGTRKVSLVISGMITWPLMVWNDGAKSDAFIVTDEMKRPRLRFAGEARIDADWSAGYVLEIGPHPDPFTPMDQHAFDGFDGAQEMRYAYWSLSSRQLGQLSMGLQSQSTDAITEVSLANTSTVMTPGLPLMLGYVSHGFFMRRDADKVLTGLRFGDILLRGRTDIWGEGHRWNVVRYDTPSLAGFTISASWGENDVSDVAVRYSGQSGRLKFAVGAGMARWADSAKPNARGCARVDAATAIDCWEIGGSLSVMDTETGLFLNAAAGQGYDKNIAPLYGNVPGIDDTAEFYYLVGGIERTWFPLGKTTLFGQYWRRRMGAGVLYTGERIDATPLGAEALVSGAEVSIWGASVVQELAEGVEVYASFNHTQSDIGTSPTGSMAGSLTTQIAPFDFLLAGMAVRF
ncbi:MAG TPA: porin [Hyphomicrobium sp.]|nr:porin [Hyphomicrobium sp.]